MSSSPNRVVERDIGNGDAPLDATSGEHVSPGDSTPARTSSEAVGSGNQRGFREQATCHAVPSSLPTLQTFDTCAEVNMAGKPGVGSVGHHGLPGEPFPSCLDEWRKENS